MTSIKRRAAAVAAPLLLALSLTACGGDDGSSAPDDASTEDFCTAFADTPSSDGSDEDAALDEAHDYADKLAEVGTSSDFDGEAREGFEAYVDFVKDIDSGDLEDFENAEGPDDVFGGDDADKVTAFITQAASVCADQLGGEIGSDTEGEPSDTES